MTATTTIYSPDDVLEWEINRDNSAHGHRPTLTIRCRDLAVSIFITEDQLADLAEVVNEAADSMELSCGTCHGDGELTIGHERDTRYTQGDPINVECPTCEGLGKVTVEHLRDSLGGSFHDADTAIDFMRSASEADY